MENEVMQYQGGAVVNFEEFAMSAESVVRQVNLVQDVMKKVMRDGEHFGIIPGCQKPSLYKPGAEKLGFTFRLAPEYDVKTIDMPYGHREYQVRCRLRHIPTGAMVGEGVGSCTTMEGKFRFRGGEKEGTGQPVPKEYWNMKNAGKTEDAKMLIGGDGYGVGKIDGQWQICEIGEKVEHDNPADYYNTCEKMAKKRAHVDAILTATAASDIFTQDIEDMPEVIPGAAKKEGKPPLKEPAKKESKKETASDTKATYISGVQIVKQGETNGKHWTIYGITDEDNGTYKTFSETLYNTCDEASIQHQLVKLAFNKTDKGNNLVSVEVEGAV